MPLIDLVVPHALSPSEAAERLKSRMREAKRSYQGNYSDLREQWSGNRLSYAFTVMSLQVHGTVAIEADAVRISADLPVAAMFFRGTIESQLRDEMERLLA